MRIESVQSATTTALSSSEIDSWIDYFDNKSTGRRVSAFAGGLIHVQDAVDGVEYWVRPLMPLATGAEYLSWSSHETEEDAMVHAAEMPDTVPLFPVAKTVEGRLLSEQELNASLCATGLGYFDREQVLLQIEALAPDFEILAEPCPRCGDPLRGEHVNCPPEGDEHFSPFSELVRAKQAAATADERGW